MTIQDNQAGGVKLDPRSISLDQQALANAIKAFFIDKDTSASGSIAVAIQTYLAALPATGATEPVAWRYAVDDRDFDFTDDPKAAERYARNGIPVEPLFASPLKPSEAMVEAAAREFLLHKGETPWRTTRGGVELWENYAPAMRAALTAALSGGAK